MLTGAGLLDSSPATLFINQSVMSFKGSEEYKSVDVKNLSLGLFVITFLFTVCFYFSYTPEWHIVANLFVAFIDTWVIVILIHVGGAFASYRRSKRKANELSR